MWNVQKITYIHFQNIIIMKQLLHAVVLICICISTSTSSNPTSPFTSPNYPGNYPLNIDQETVITVAPGSKIQLIFDDFMTEDNGNGCHHDYVEGTF